MSAGAARARVRSVLVIASLAACFVGIGSLTQGLAVPIKAKVAQHGLEQTFERRLAASRSAAHRVRGDGGAGFSGLGASKLSALPADGPVAKLSVERLGVHDIVLAGQASHDQLARGPTLLKRVGVTNQVTILAAHRDTHFRFIRDLRAGDLVSLQLVTGEVERYRIVRFETVRWNEFTYPLDVAQPLLALTTCYPFGGTEYGGPWRRVAWGERVG